MPTTPETKLGLSINDAAELTGLSAKTIRRAISRGDLASFRIGTRITLRPSDVEAWLFAVPNVPLGAEDFAPSAAPIEAAVIEAKMEPRKERSAAPRPRARRAPATYPARQTQPRRGSLQP